MTHVRLFQAVWRAGRLPKGHARCRQLLSFCEEQGTTPLLIWRLAPPASSELAQVSRQQAAQEMAREAELCRVLDAFSQAQIPALILKGTALAYSLYPLPWLRPRLDTDLLISPAHRQNAQALLIQLGYQVSLLSGEDLLFGQRPFVLKRCGISHVIDLHWELSARKVLAKRFPAARLFETAQPLTALHPHAQGLSLPLALIVACAHPVMHHPEDQRLIWLADVYLLAKTMTVAHWEQVKALLQEESLGAIVTRALELAQAAFGTLAIPTLLPRTLHPDFSFLLRTQCTRWAEMVSDLFALGWKDRVQFLREIFFPSRAYLQARGLTGPFLPWIYLKRAVRGLWRSWVGVALFLLASQSARPQTGEPAVPPLERTLERRRLITVPTEYTLSYNFITFTNEKGAAEKLGLVGFKLLLQPGNGFMAGLAAFGGATGSRGGFFGAGLTAGYDLAIESVTLRTELFAGGSRGARLPTGGGLMLRGAASLGYDLGAWQPRAGAAFTFFPGGLESLHPFIEVSVPSDFTYIPPKLASEEKETRSTSDPWQRSHWRLIPHFKLYFPLGQQRVANLPLSVLTVTGLTIDHALHPRLSTRAVALGVVAGDGGGFLSLGGGLAYHIPLSGWLTAASWLHVSSAGGGQIDTGSGLILEPGLELEARLTPAMGMLAEAGYLHALAGGFRAATTGLSAVIRLEGFESAYRPTEIKESVRFVTAISSWRIGLGPVVYLAQGMTGAGGALLPHIALLGAQVDYRVKKGFFLGGSAAWPFTGRTGGFTTGLFHAGIVTNLAPRFDAELDLGIGPASSGNNERVGGFTGKATLNFDYRFTGSVLAYGGGGVIAFSRGHVMPVVNTGVRYAFGLPIGLPRR